MACKSQTSNIQKEFEKNAIVRQFPKGVVRWHTDGGGEYLPDLEEGDATTAPETPGHNPFAESVNRTSSGSCTNYTGRSLLELEVVDGMCLLCGLHQESTILL